MASVAANVSSSCSPSSSGGNQVSSTVMVNEKASRNKRKFRAETPLADMNNMAAPSQNECTTYDFSAEKFDFSHNHGEGSCDVCGCLSEDYPDTLKVDIGRMPNALGAATGVGLCKAGPSRAIEDVHLGELHQDVDWSDLTESQLEELVLNNLDAIFQSAIKKIVACGYTEEVATRAVLRSGLCYGCKDTTSNIVDNTLAFLQNGQESDSSKEHCFEDLQQLQKYILAELVCVLRAVRPFFSNGDAMWCLLICDMNVSHACAMDGEPLGNFAGDAAPSGSFSTSTQPQQHMTEVKVSETSVPIPCKPVPRTHCAQCTHCTQPEISAKAGVSNVPQPKNSVVLNGLVREKECSSSTFNAKDKSFQVTIKTMSPALEEKTMASRKTHPSSSKRDSILRQKYLHPEKSYLRTYSCKGSSRAGKLNSLGGLILDKKLKSVGDAASINLKNASLGRNKEIGVDIPHDNGQPKLPTNAGSVSDLSVAGTELSLALPTNIIAAPVPLNSDASTATFQFSGIPYDKSLGKWLPQNKKDEMILKLIPRTQELHNQLHEWTEWANQKVMQAARRLSKDKAELQALKQEKLEAERIKRETQTLEENTMKKISEMENALCKASGQAERATCTARILEAENTALRHEMEGAKLQAAESAASCQEVSKREKNTQMKIQSWGKQKAFLQEELSSEKRKLAQLQQKVSHAQDHLDQTEARWKQEQKAKEELLAQASSIKKEREEMEASAKSKEDIIKSKAEKSLQKYEDDIHKLEKEISKLRLKSDSSKIAALRRGIDGSYASKPSDTRNNSLHKDAQKLHISNMVSNIDSYTSNGGVKRERECVMCLSEEMSVVFLPCAHQVVCVACNELHEKQGMKDCPSCRTPILRRINIRYARS